MLNIPKIRADFPILAQQVNGHPLVYLDNAATTQKPRQVIDALVRYYETSNANIHRGIHTLAQRATDDYERSRSVVARFIGAGSSDEIVFTRNATEAINLVAYAWGDQAIGDGDEILLSLMEHHSNIVPWQLLAQRKGATLKFIGLTPTGQLDLESFRALLSSKTRLVSIVHASNVLGTINPVAEIAAAAHEVGARVLVDAAQSVPHLPVDVQQLGADFVAFSAHKMLGPTGVGVLWAKSETLNSMQPFLGGGDMISIVMEGSSTWADVPHKFEAGTPNIADVIAFAPAIEYLESLGMDAVREHELRLTAFAMDELEGLRGVTLHGPRPAAERTGVVSFEIEGVHPHDLATIADGHGVAIRAGHHCAQPLMRWLGVPATSRASFSVYNEPGEIAVLVEAIRHAQKVFA